MHASTEKKTWTSLGVIGVLLLAGCMGAAGVTKNAARESDGIGPDGEDLCAEHGWYADGECDPFCVELDLDCGCPDPGDPEVEYISDDPSVCAAAFFECGPSQTPFGNECGCGCIGPTSLSCLDPGDPEVEYIYDDPSECAAALFECDPGQRPFGNECGCGCVGPTSLSPEQCADQDGEVIGDPGDGSTHSPDYTCADGSAPLGSVDDGSIEGAVCCPAAPRLLSETECTALGGYVVGDIGDGSTHDLEFRCPDGQRSLGSVAFGVEGGACCPR